MSQIDHDVSAIDCLFETILGFMLPFFLVGAGGSPDIAGAAVRELIDAYGAGTSTELDLVGRIVGFSIAALDNLRLSMTTGMSDTKVLRYRCNAVTLSRASDQARTILEAVQAKPEQTRRLPRPAVAAAPAAVEAPRAPVPAAVSPAPARVEPPLAASPAAVVPAPVRIVPSRQPGPPVQPAAALRFMAPAANGGACEVAPMDIESLKRDARVMLGAFSRNAAQGSASMLLIPDAATVVAAAARAAVSAVRRAPAA
jgi:hypothetical protein